MMYFWWSNDYLARVGVFEKVPTRTAMIDGELVNYCVCHDSKIDAPTLDTDLEYLGCGEIYAIDGLRQ